MPDQGSNKQCCGVSRQEISETNIKPDTVQHDTSTSKKRIEEEMTYIPGGEFLMGTTDPESFPEDGERPIHKVHVHPFLMDIHTVTNVEFAEFIQETGYKTESELYQWSFVFYHLLPVGSEQYVKQQVPQTSWWLVVEGADWRHPEGPDSNIEDRRDHPVIQVSWNDAMAYCKWVNKRLPTEAEREFAARGGLEQNIYPWGNELTPEGEHKCNIWQGDFPKHNTLEDGYFATAPAQSFPTNQYGLYNVSGNVWEWCSDWFAKNIHKRGGRDNPQGPDSGTDKVMKGGSYLCHYSYCNRYRVAARTGNTPDSSTGNIGFRCVKDIDR